MKIPVIKGVIDRRILVNYRIDPAPLARLLPAPFRPKLVRGRGIAGICLIRLRDLRPRALPVPLGIGSENAAHRIAVEWDEGGATRQGVFVERRDSSSVLNALAGGRIFPGVHHHARFDVAEEGGRYRVALESDDGATRVEVEGATPADLPAGSVFGSLEEASRFFEEGSLGYSPAREAGRFDGLELRIFAWKVEPLGVTKVRSSFFEDPARFPAGSVELDCALLMRGIDHEWHARETLASVGGTAPEGRPMT